MRLRFSSFLFVILFISCSFAKRTPNQSIEIIDIIAHAQAFSPDGVMREIHSSNRLVAMGKNRLFIVPKVRYTLDAILNRDGKKIGDSVSKMDTSYTVYAYQNGDNRALEYTMKNFKNETGVIFGIDSVLKKRGISPDYYKSFEIEIGQPLDVQVNDKKLLEKYAIKKTNIAEPDSIYRYFNADLKNIDFTFSKKLDELHNSKLYKVTYVFNKIPIGVVLPDKEIPRRENYYEIKRGTEKDMKVLEELFEKFIADSKVLFKQ